MGSKYYESELQYLREMGREFAQVHPSTAGLLAERGSDPDVERLLEGVAFLTSRVRERIDDAVPAVVHGLMQLLLPQFLRTVPSTSIVQYEPNISTLRGIHVVDRGTPVASIPVRGVSCEFRTTQAVELLPLELLEAFLDETISSRPTLRLRFQTTQPGRELLRRKQGIRILLFGESSVTSTLSYWMLRFFTGASIQCDGGPLIELGSDVLRPVGFGREEAVIPWPRMAHEGYRHLQEYFTIPEKFHFFDIMHFDRVDELTSNHFELALSFERPPALNQRVDTGNFRLFCTPVINLFDVSGEPIKLDARVHEHLLRASGFNPQQMEVYDVRSVIGVRQGRAERREYKPFVGFHHAKASKESVYYTLRPSPSPIDDGTDTYLSIVTPLGKTPSQEEEVLSLELVATNRSLPAELQLGEINTSPRGISTAAPFRNISAVTNPIRPKLGSEILWRMLSHLAIARSSLGDRETLQALLNLYNFQQETAPAVGRANELKVQSIRKIDSKPATRLMGGAPVRGVETIIEVEESKLGTPGQAFAFGCMLNEFYASHVGLNSFNELHLHLHPSKTEMRWDARSGDRRIL